MPSPKVVIATIFHPAKEYAYQIFLDWAKSVKYDNLDFICKVHMGKYGSHGELKAIREQIRRDALEDEAAALLFVDIDTIGPPEAIQEFLDTPADIMTGIYFSRASQHRAVCWKNSDPDQQFLNTEVYTEIDGAGMGFCFIRRAVLESITFDWPVPDDDYPAWHQAKKKGFRLLSLNMMRCRHYNSKSSYVYHAFGEINEVKAEEYTIQCPDGITLNGHHYPRGKSIVDHRLIKTVRELDEPYRTKKIKSVHRMVSVVGKAQSGVTPTHTKTHSPGKVSNRVPARTKKDEDRVGIWKLPRR
jgi:hypothetical protein